MKKQKITFLFFSSLYQFSRLLIKKRRKVALNATPYELHLRIYLKYNYPLLLYKM